MAGKIPPHFIDQLLTRVDIVEVIDRRVPLIRKGKEYQACCPFHEERTPSFTVSPTKQFFHCFGCGAHGSAIGFLMDYANLGFIEAVEELADGAGLQVPRTDSYQSGASESKESTVQLVEIVEKASQWFQQQLRTHAEAKAAIAYLKKRGLDGRIAAEFGIGYAPDGWDNLAREFSDTNQQQLLKAGLVAKRESSGGQSSSQSNVYDRFRGRIIFPIEDHRGRVVAFGGRSVGSGEPKYLNSPETPLFHKGAELYGLHRARRAVGREKRSLVVEGYMDVVSLAQFGIDYAVATLGTATTRTHVQRLFRLAPEIVFCFDGDRAGRDAAWKAMQTALPEMRDGKQINFLFLPDGEDPDTVVRAENQDGFSKRIEQASPLTDFLFDSLVAQVDMKKMEGRARLVELAKPLLAQIPEGALQEMMFAKLSELSGLSESQLKKYAAEKLTADNQRTEQARNLRGSVSSKSKSTPGQISPLASAISLLLQNPKLALSITDSESLKSLNVKGVEILRAMIEKINSDPEITTARLLELFREESSYAYMTELATRENMIEVETSPLQINDTLAKLTDQNSEQHISSLIEQTVQEGGGKDAQELQQKIKKLLDERKLA